MAETIVFDIESGPLPDGELERIAPPFDSMSVKGSDIIEAEFDPDAVKTGNVKAEDKIAAKIEAAREKHAADVKAMVGKVEQARLDYWQKFKSKAALKALTGKVLACGYLGPKGGLKGISGGDEPAILLKFWEVFQEQVDRGNRMLGFNIFGFDLPFIIHRSWILGLSFPFQIVRDGRYWNAVFIDLAEHWRLGVHGEYVSLNDMAKALGVGSKLEGVSGADFARLWAEDRAKAKAYLINDLEITRGCAAKLGCLIEGES